LRGSVILALAAAFSAHTAAAAPKVVAVNVDGVIHPVTTEIVGSAIALAKRENAALLIIRLNTPGGLMDAMHDTIAEIESSPVPVVTYVAPSGVRAASAGFFILESGDVAAMAPGTNTGAAHPVALGGEMDAVMKEKVENDAAAYMRSICARRGRNATVAETTVRESKSFTETEALNQHLIDLIAPSDQALLQALDGRAITRFDGAKQTLHTAGAEIEEYHPSLRQSFVSAIADPNIALIILVIGGLCVYIEFIHFSGHGRARRNRRHYGAVGPFRAVGAAYRLVGRGPAAGGVHPVRSRSQIRLARGSRRGRRGLHGAGRSHADR
jgi:membrane-bound serine protease (ClpP class)